MGNKSSKQMEQLSTITPDNVEALWVEFDRRYPGGSLTRSEFIRDNISFKGGEPEFWGNLFDAIDESKNGLVDFREYLMLLTVSSSSTPTDELLSFVFRLLDVNKDGRLDRAEVSNASHVFYKKLRFMAPVADIFPSEYLLDEDVFLDYVFKEMDLDKNGYVSEEEFRTVCTETPQIQQVFLTTLDQFWILADSAGVHDLAAVESESHQVGGHREIIYRDDIIYKPLVKEEWEFYEKIYGSQAEASEIELRALSPRYDGKTFFHFPSKKRKRKKDVRNRRQSWKAWMRNSPASPVQSASEEEGEGETAAPVAAAAPAPEADGGIVHKVTELGGIVSHFLILENLTRGMQRVCILDVKLGKEGYARKHTSILKLHKKIYQAVIQKISTSSSHGFRLSGMKSYNAKTKGWLRMTKTQGKFLRKKKVQDAFEAFFNNGHGVRVSLVRRAIPKLERIAEFFRTQTKFAFFSTSVLFMYDGDVGEEEPPPGAVDSGELVVKLIDYAHVFEASPKAVDKNNLFGVESLLRICRSIVAKYDGESEEGEGASQAPPPAAAADEADEGEAEAEAVGEDGD